MACRRRFSAPLLAFAAALLLGTPAPARAQWWPFSKQEPTSYGLRFVDPVTGQPVTAPVAGIRVGERHRLRLGLYVIREGRLDAARPLDRGPRGSVTVRCISDDPSVIRLDPAESPLVDTAMGPFAEFWMIGVAPGQATITAEAQLGGEATARTWFGPITVQPRAPDEPRRVTPPVTPVKTDPKPASKNTAVAGKIVAETSGAPVPEPDTVSTPPAPAETPSEPPTPKRPSTALANPMAVATPVAVGQNDAAVPSAAEAPAPSDPPGEPVPQPEPEPPVPAEEPEPEPQPEPSEPPAEPVPPHPEKPEEPPAPAPIPEPPPPPEPAPIPEPPPPPEPEPIPKPQPPPEPGPLPEPEQPPPPGPPPPPKPVEPARPDEASTGLHSGDPSAARSDSTKPGPTASPAGASPSPFVDPIPPPADPVVPAPLPCPRFDSLVLRNVSDGAMQIHLRDAGVPDMATVRLGPGEERRVTVARGEALWLDVRRPDGQRKSVRLQAANPQLAGPTAVPPFGQPWLQVAPSVEYCR